MHPVRVSCIVAAPHFVTVTVLRRCQLARLAQNIHSQQFFFYFSFFFQHILFVLICPGVDVNKLNIFSKYVNKLNIFIEYVMQHLLRFVECFARRLMGLCARLVRPHVSMRSLSRRFFSACNHAITFYVI
jgi:hypothetical protein